ncbi:uncharacterized protein PG998_009931 [Apiospora kogelbergensis]|uniref:Uncharacterized protein n=1 Tax=Apiospora kogelbergensis TaxID=1337665 RepID=A0AAW0R997_9PEZI
MNIKVPALTIVSKIETPNNNTLNKAWWADTCEDAVTFKQTSETSKINDDVFCGTNISYSDTCSIADSFQGAGKFCNGYAGNVSEVEPSKDGSASEGQ